MERLHWTLIIYPFLYQKWSPFLSSVPMSDVVPKVPGSQQIRDGHHDACQPAANRRKQRRRSSCSIAFIVGESVATLPSF